MSKLNTLFAVLNKDIPFGRSLNALAHMCLGIGHRIPEGKMPSVEVYFADNGSIHRLRHEFKLHASGAPGFVLSDFINTMTEGTAEDQLRRTADTPRESLQYYGVTICTDNIAGRFIKGVLGGTNRALVGYKPFVSTPEQREFEFTGVRAGADRGDSMPPHKASIILSKLLPPAELVNLVPIASIEIGRKADISSLRLLNFVDADGEQHPGISYHPFTILTVKSQSKLESMAQKACAMKDIASSSLVNAEGITALTCVFGLRELVEDCISKKDTSLLSKEITEGDLMPPEVVGALPSGVMPEDDPAPAEAMKKALPDEKAAKVDSDPAGAVGELTGKAVAKADPGLADAMGALPSEAMLEDGTATSGVMGAVNDGSVADS